MGEAEIRKVVHKNITDAGLKHEVLLTISRVAAGMERREPTDAKDSANRIRNLVQEGVIVKYSESSNVVFLILHYTDEITTDLTVILNLGIADYEGIAFSGICLLGFELTVGLWQGIDIQAIQEKWPRSLMRQFMTSTSEFYY